jgi:hypothetical protein
LTVTEHVVRGAVPQFAPRTSPPLDDQLVTSATECVSVTVVPVAKSALHTPGQLIPPVLDTIVPDAPLRTTVNVAVVANLAVTLSLLSNVIVQVAAVPHPGYPAHVEKVEDVSTAVKITVSPGGKRKLQGEKSLSQ